MLVRVAGTPLAGTGGRSIRFEFIRTIAVARILMPASTCACRPAARSMNEQMQALSFFAGANSIFYGEKLLTTPQPAGRHATGRCSRAWASTPRQRHVRCAAPAAPQPVLRRRGRWRGVVSFDRLAAGLAAAPRRRPVSRSG